RAFEARAGSTRTERGDAGLAQLVGDAEHERILGADDDEVDVLLRRELHDRSDVADLERDVARDLRRADVAGRAQDLGLQRRLRELPAQRVLASTAAHDQDLHDSVLLSLARWM